MHTKKNTSYHLLSTLWDESVDHLFSVSAGSTARCEMAVPSKEPGPSQEAVDNINGSECWNYWAARGMCALQSAADLSIDRFLGTQLLHQLSPAGDHEAFRL